MNSKFINTISPSREELLKMGFKELPHFTIMNSLEYDLGRNRVLSVGSLGTFNEMIFLCYSEDEDKEVIVLRNYDYDGFTSLENIKSIIEGITKNNKNNKHDEKI